MSDIIDRLRAAVPRYEGTPIAWPCEVRSELLLEAAAQIEHWRSAHKDACAGKDVLRAEVIRLTRERDEALEQRTEQRSLTDGLVADIKRLDREIEKLRAGNEKLREALKKIARRAPYVADFPWKVARDALEGGR